MELQPRELLLFITSSGRKPFSDWLSTLTADDRAIIRNRLDRVEKGNFGDVKSLGKKVVLLLLGGDKSTQSKDIKLAKKYWNEYKKKS